MITGLKKGEIFLAIIERQIFFSAKNKVLFIIFPAFPDLFDCKVSESERALTCLAT